MKKQNNVMSHKPAWHVLYITSQNMKPKHKNILAVYARYDVTLSQGVEADQKCVSF
jgi:hypothetical protein